jgi:hypothetical protein
MNGNKLGSSKLMNDNKLGSSKLMNDNKVGNVHIIAALTRVRITTVAVAKHYYKFRVFVCSLCYCSMKVCVPYYTAISGLSG